MFFSNIKDLLSVIGFEASIETFLNLVLIINLFRIIQCTSLHPRLATLTGTMFRAMDDLWHTLILIFLVLGCFAAVGTWRFGSSRQEFATISATVSTELSIMFSANFFNNWDASLDLQVYTVLFLVIVFLLILNFLLAIIVDAFMDIRKHNVELEIEQEFFTDVISIFISRAIGKFRGWPPPGSIGHVLSQQKAKLNVGFLELQKTGLFKNPNAISTFIKFYGEYEFLQPIHVTKWGKPPTNKNEELLMEIKKLNQTLLFDLKKSIEEEFCSRLLIGGTDAKSQPERKDFDDDPLVSHMGSQSLKQSKLGSATTSKRRADKAINTTPEQHTTHREGNGLSNQKYQDSDIQLICNFEHEKYHPGPYAPQVNPPVRPGSKQSTHMNLASLVLVELPPITQSKMDSKPENNISNWIEDRDLDERLPSPVDRHERAGPTSDGKAKPI